MMTRANTAACLLLLAALTAGCGGRSSRALPDDAGAYCSGGARLGLNGSAYNLWTVKGSALAMGCCDGAIVTFTAGSGSGKSATVTAAIKVYGPVTAGVMDLANLPKGVEVFVSYQPCSPPVCSTMYRMDAANDIFTGTVTLSGTPYQDLRATLCLSAQASSGDPNFSSVALWAEGVPIK